MTAVYRLEGLSCAHCAAKIERATGKIKKVNSASVGFMASKLYIEYEEGADLARLESAVKRAAPEVTAERV